MSRGVCLAVMAVSLFACAGPRSAAEGNAQRGALNPPPTPPARYALGRTPSDSELKAADIDVNPTGAGLPEGQGTPAEGAKVFAARCALCHGAKGEGTPPNYPALVGRDPRQGFPFGKDVKLARTVGNYWPYATTIFDYVHRAMPQLTPGALSANETYAVTAWILAENEIIPRDAVMDARSLPAVKMPGREHFVPDDRRGGAEFK